MPTFLWKKSVLNVMWNICTMCLPMMLAVLAWKHRMHVSPWITQLIYPT